MQNEDLTHLRDGLLGGEHNDIGTRDGPWTSGLDRRLDAIDELQSGGADGLVGDSVQLGPAGKLQKDRSVAALSRRVHNIQTLELTK